MRVRTVLENFETVRCYLRLAGDSSVGLPWEVAKFLMKDTALKVMVVDYAAVERYALLFGNLSLAQKPQE